MNKWRRTGVALRNGLYGIIKYPIENIEVAMASIMLIIAIAIVTPQAGMVYGNIFGKLIFSFLLGWPAVPIIYWKVRKTAEEYAAMLKKRKRKIFGLSLAFSYIMVLSAIIQHPWPPHWVPYLGLAAISWIAYIRLVI
jgi:hypothetical protein